MLMVTETTGNLRHLVEASNEVVGLDFRTPRLWLAFIARASCEQKAADRLRECRIRAYWPNYCVTEAIGRHQGNGHRLRGARLRSIIPGFIFVAVGIGAEPEFDLHAIVDETPGLLGYMRNGSGEVAQLREADIQQIRKIEGDHNLPPARDHVHNFKMGDKVRFKHAPAWVGKVIEFCSDGRLSVGVLLFGRVVPVKGMPHQVERI
jgi:transcription antitermination factor NusG